MDKCHCRISQRSYWPYRSITTKSQLITWQNDFLPLKNQVIEIESRYSLDGKAYSATMVVEELKKLKTPKAKLRCSLAYSRRGALI